MYDEKLSTDTHSEIKDRFHNIVEQITLNNWPGVFYINDFVFIKLKVEEVLRHVVVKYKPICFFVIYK